jgi:hypothetical protein
MTPDNFRVVLGAFSKMKPFAPFSLELVSGARMEVNHPEALTLYKELVVYVSTSMVRSVFEYASVVRFIGSTGTI